MLSKEQHLPSPSLAQRRRSLAFFQPTSIVSHSHETFTLRRSCSLVHVSPNFQPNRKDSGSCRSDHWERFATILEDGQVVNEVHEMSHKVNTASSRIRICHTASILVVPYKQVQQYTFRELGGEPNETERRCKRDGGSGSSYKRCE